MKTPTTLKNRFNFLFLFMILGMGSVWGQTSQNVSCPWISQNVCNDGTWSLCGHTSVEMVLSKYEYRSPNGNNVVDYNEMIRDWRGQIPSSSCECSGTPSPNHLIWLLNQKGYNAKWYGNNNTPSNYSYCGVNHTYENKTGELSLQDLVNFLDNDIPVIVQVHTKMNTSNETHWMVLREIGTDYVKVNDPGVGDPSTGNNRQFTRTQFLNSWQSSSCDKITIVVDKKRIPNQSLPIYAGTKTNPKPFELFFPKTDIGDETPTLITDIKVNGVTLPHSLSSGLVVPTLRNSHQPPYAPIYSVVIEPNNNAFSSLSNNNSYSISFKVTTSSNNTYTFSGSNQVYLKDRTSLDTSITGVNAWMAPYVRNGVGWGLFTGNGGVSSTNFGATDTLKRAQAAVVIVRAAIYAHAPNRAINTSNASNYFTDVPASGGEYSYAYIYAHTLRNWGVIGAGTSFNPDGNITMKEFARWLDLAMGFNSTDVAPQSLQDATLSRIVFNVTGNNASNYLASLNKLSKIITYESPSTGVNVFETFYTFSDFSSLPPSLAITGTITVNGELTMTRGKMAKFITNAFKYAHKKNTGSYPSFRLNSENATTIDLNNVTIIGDKFENADIPVGSEPVPPSQVTFSCNSGGHINMYYENDYDTSGNPKFFYWSMEKNGATLTSETDSHRKVRFTAPTVSSPNQWKVYSYTANNKGKFKETIITINVGGSSSGSDAAPTNQAHSLSLYGATSSSLTASWTRGNGQKCIVTCKEVGANAQDVPDYGVIYTGNTNFNSAPSIFNGSDTKVVYTGTGTSCTITGLNPNTQYQVAVFEYNGTTSSTVKYNLNNAPISTKSTLASVNTTPLANFTWDESLTFQTGQSFVFTNTSTNSNTYQWSITPSENISNTTSASTTNVTFTNSGQHTLTLIATNTNSGETSTRTHNFYVYSATELLADLQPTNLNFTNPMIGGQNLTITCNVQNNSTASQSYTTHITFVLSSDQIIDASDHFLGQSDFTIQAGQSISVNHMVDNIYNYFSGNYYIIAKVDYWTGIPNGYVLESNEDNNIVIKPIVIQQALPDFVAHSVSLSQSTVFSGQNITVSGTFQNIGGGDKNGYSPIVSLYISDDSVFSSDDRMLLYALYTNGVLDYANSPIVSASYQNIRIPYTLPNGNYYLFAAIDFSFIGLGFTEDRNVEVSENNNWIGTPIAVNNPSQPTINASQFSIDNITENSLKLHWQRGNGDACIVLGCDKTELPKLTIDGVNYNADSNFSNAVGINGLYLNNEFQEYYNNISNVKVLYDGTENNVVINGLTPNETYSFLVIEYNNINGFKDYMQSITIKGVSTHTQGQDASDVFKRLYGTTNASSTHSPVFPLTVHFFNENDGVFFRNENGVAKTNNKGKTWTFIYNKLIEKNKDKWLVGSSWLENGYGWIGFENGSLLKTTNYGDSWTEKKFDRNISDVYFVNQNVGFVSFKSILNTSSNEGAIYKTENGGNTWINIGTFPRPVSSVFFLNENMGWATTYSTSSSFVKIFLKTINGGQTWEQYSFTTTPSQGSSLIDIYFIDENRGFATTLFGWLLKTTNGGISWEMQNLFDFGVSINTYSKIEFINDNVGYINLKNEKLAKTDDCGVNWQILTIQDDYTNSQGQIAEIDVLDENIVYVGGISGVLKTITGGTNNLISIDEINTNYCSNSQMTLPYSIQGVFDNSNEFLVQLSDSNGSFATPTVLSSFVNVSNGQININIPANISNGSSYKIRIVSSNPVVLSNESNSFSIVAGNESVVSITLSNSNLCPNQSVTLTTNPINGGTSPTYTWKRNGQIVGENSNEITILDPSNDDVFWVEMLSSETCSSNVPSVSNAVSVNITLLDEIFIQAIDNILAASTDVGVQWIRNGQPIAGATSQFYEAIQTGFYQFSVTINGCTILSEIHALTSLSNLNDITLEKNGIKAFPNPFENTLTITAENTIISFTMYDLQGRVIHTSKVNKLETTVEMQDIPQAVYILEVVTEKGKEYLKIVKN